MFRPLCVWKERTNNFGGGALHERERAGSALFGYGVRDGGVLVNETPRLPKELNAFWNRWSSTWLPAICPIPLVASGQWSVVSTIHATAGH